MSQVLSNLSELKKAHAIYIVSETPRGTPPTTDTKKQRSFLIKVFFKFLEQNRLEFNILSVNLFIETIRKTGGEEGTALAYKRQIKSFLNFLEKFDFISYEENFAKRINIRELERKDIRFVDNETCKKIISEGCKVGPFDNKVVKKGKIEKYFAANLMLRTGLRIDEVIHLDGRDFDFASSPPGFMAKVKAQIKKQWTAMPVDMIEELKKRVGRERMFEIHEKGMNEMLKKGARVLGLPDWNEITNHTLRRTFLTSKANDEVYPPILMKLAHHKKLETTLKYYVTLDKQDMFSALNSPSGAVKNGLGIESAISRIVQAIKKTKVETDDRFKVDYQISTKELVVRLSEK